jgi:hypothetical protein
MDLLPFPSTQTTPAVKKINGKKLSRRLKSLSPTFLALLANELMSGTAVVSHLTFEQAKAVTGASTGYLTTVRRLTPEQLEQVKREPASLSPFHNKREMTDAEIERRIVKMGIEKVLAAIDRLTAPPVLVAVG